MSPRFKRPVKVRLALSPYEAEMLAEALALMLDREPEWFHGPDRAAITRMHGQLGIAMLTAGEAKVAR